MRFGWRVLGAIRERVGPTSSSASAWPSTRRSRAASTRRPVSTSSARLEADGLVDFVNVIRGYIADEPSLTEVIPIHGMPSAPHLDFAGRVRAATQLPVLHASKIDDVATARHAIREGKVDLVGMTRAQLADPHLVRKIIEGREDEIRPCVGATYCLDRIYEAGEALCIHNAATSREETMPHEIPARRPPPGRRRRRRPGRPRGRPRGGRARPRRHGAGGDAVGRRPDPPGRAQPTPQGPARHRRMAGASWPGSVSTCASTSSPKRPTSWRSSPMS